MGDAHQDDSEEWEPSGPAEASPGPDPEGSTRELIVELALTESALRSNAEAGEPVEALIRQEGEILEELRHHGVVGFKALGEDEDTLAT